MLLKCSGLEHVIRLYNRANRKTFTSVISACVFVCVCHCFDMWFSEGHLHVLCMLCNGRWITSRLLFKGSVMVVCWGQITYYISVRHKFCSHCVVARCACEGRTLFWKQANHHFGVTRSALFALELRDVFLRARTGATPPSRANQHRGQRSRL